MMSESLNGSIGTLDGLLVRVVRLSWLRYLCRNLLGYFSRKGFYAINI